MIKWLFLFSFCFWKGHKDHPQCYLVSPPVHQSGPRLLGIDLWSRINALFHSHWYSRDCQRYRAAPYSKWERLFTHRHTLSLSFLLCTTFLLSFSRGLVSNVNLKLLKTSALHWNTILVLIAHHRANRIFIVICTIEHNTLDVFQIIYHPDYWDPCWWRSIENTFKQT